MSATITAKNLRAAEWKLTTMPESKRGLHELRFDDKYLGHEKERERVQTSLKSVHATYLFGTNPWVETPETLRNGLELLRKLFPNDNEREDGNLVAARLSDQTQRRGVCGCFDVLVNCDQKERVIGWHQFSTIPLGGSDEALTFLQYAGIADKKIMQELYGTGEGHRGKGIVTLNCALMGMIAEENAKNVMRRPGGHRGTILESEYLGQADSLEAIRFTAERLKIHGHMGAKAILLRMPNGSLISPHLQPSLGETSKPIKLLLLFRPAHYDPETLTQTEEITLSDAKAIVMAFLDNFDAEGFDASHVDAARFMVQSWFDQATGAVLCPPSALPDVINFAAADPLLARYMRRDYGHLVAHQHRIEAALRKQE